MADPNRRYADNIDGRFYVDDDCIYCGLCAEIAPVIFAPAESLDHDIVVSQPKTRKEIELCLEAKESCPVEAIGDEED